MKPSTLVIAAALTALGAVAPAGAQARRVTVDYRVSGDVLVS